MPHDFNIRAKRLGTQINAKRIYCREDIPKELRCSNILIRNNTIFTNGCDGHKEAPLGSVIGYCESNLTSSGFSAWPIEDAEISLIEKDGLFYKKPSLLKACVIPKKDEEWPEWAEKCKIVYEDMTIVRIQTLQGIVFAIAGVDYLVFYGNNQYGSPKTKVILKDSPSCTKYIVCDENGKDIGPLNKICPA